jgi:hypothetical protein|tara:strand:- start:7208 stop:7681 length:474 start_codon:yes stop_codon:yes gene_type:complete
VIQEGDNASSNDMTDLVLQSVHTAKQVTDDDGKISIIQYLDNMSLWCKTLSVASNTLSQVIFELMEWIRNGGAAKTNMCVERANEWETVVMAVSESVRKTLDSKSSESMVNKDNKQSTLLDKVNRSSSEKIFTMKENAKGSLWDSIMGKEKDKMSDD